MAMVERIKNIVQAAFLVVFCTGLAWSQDGVPTIVINPKGHSARINNILYSQDGSQIISVSEDKTIRVWDAETGEMIKKYESEIGEGSEGMLYASALAPNGRYLAVAGYPVSSQKSNYIIVIDLKREMQVATAIGHQNVISSLGFSGDGKYLVSGDDDGIVKFWKVSRSKFWDEMAEANVDGPVYDLSVSSIASVVAISTDGNNIVTIDFSSIEEGKKLPQSSLKKHKGQINKVNYSPDGKFLASSSFDGELAVWNYSGELLFMIDDFTTPINALAFSFDNKVLVALDIAGKGFSYAIPNGNLFTKDFKGHDNVVFSAAFSPKSVEGNYVIASAGGTTNEIVLWNAISAKVTKNIKGKGSFINELSFGNENQLYIATGFGSNKKTYDYSFDFSNLYLNNNPEKATLGKLNKSNRSLKINEDGLSVNLPRGATIMNDEFSDGFIRSLTSTSDGNIVVGSDFSLKLYNQQGNFIREFVGHTGGVYALAASQDGKYIASGSLDQSIKIWLANETGYAPGMEEFFADEPDVADLLKGLELDETSTEGKDSWRKVIATLKDYGDNRTARFFQEVFDNLGETVVPFANFFLAEDGEWVFWSPSGYFSCSTNGADYFGWHVNQGIESLAEYYSADQYFEILYRPQLMGKSMQQATRVKEILKKEGERVFDLTKLSRPSAGLFNVSSLTIGDDKVLNYEKGKYQTTLDKLELTVDIYDGGGGIREVNVYQNGKLIVTDSEVKSLQQQGTISRKYPVELVSDINNFRVVVVNYQGIESRPDRLKIEFIGEQIVTSSLHILAVGINKYEKESYNLNYAHDDAKSFTHKFIENASGLFKNVRNRIELYDGEATRENILKAFESIISQSKPEDMFVFYYAGHGTVDEDMGNEYYLVPPNVTQLYGDSEQLQEKAISATELKLYLSKVKSTKQLILMDACHSGAAIQKLQHDDAERQRAITNLARSSGVAMLTSSNSQQFATEFEVLKHGVFTYSLLDALDGAADTGDDQVSVYELKLFMERMVPQLSRQYGGESQRPVAHVFGNDFSISIVNPKKQEEDN